MGHVGDVGKVNFRSGVTDFAWTIENFSSLSQAVCCYYTSFDFHFRGRRWHLALYPNWDSDDNSDGYVGISLMLDDSRGPIRLRYSFGVKATDGRTQVWFNGTNTFDVGDHNNTRGELECILRSELLRRRDEFLPRDVLTVVVTLRTMMEGEADEEGTKEVCIQTEVEHKVADVSIQTEFERNIADVSTQTEVEHKVADVTTQTEAIAVNVLKESVQEKTGGAKVLQDIGKLWASGDNSDVVLKVQEVEFKAHRNILAVRTPVLGAMFQHDTQEKASGEVTIDDCDPDVFEQLLHFIYTGAPRELNAENAAALYVVADKYLVSEVKALCVQCMQNELCLDTICDYVTLSLMYNEGELLEVAVDFLSRNMIDVMETVEWQRFTKEHSTWANELLIRGMRLSEARNVRVMSNIG